MKIPMYFDFIQTSETNNKFNGISFEFSKKYFGKYNLYTNIHVLGFDDPINDIEFIKEDHQGKFYYPIFWPDIDNYFKDLVIPQFVLNQINKLQAKILIVNIFEGYSFEWLLKQVDTYFIKKYNLSFENFVFLTGNKYKTTAIKTIYYNFFQKIVFQSNTNQTYSNAYTASFNKINNTTQYYNNAYDLIFKKNDVRQYKFICLQRRPRPYRLALYTELYPYKHDGILTLGVGDNEYNIHDVFFRFEKKYQKSFKKFDKMNLMSTLPVEFDVNTSNENPAFDNNVEKFYQSYLHVVPETYFENANQRSFFSEKVFKPIIHFQPFVLFNEVNSLSKFRTMGFETFPDIIDESYDTINHYEKRFYKAVDSILEFIKQDKTTLSKIMKDIFPILTHNYYNLLTRVKNNNNNIKAELIDKLYN
jgi:hypothetical protein